MSMVTPLPPITSGTASLAVAPQAQPPSTPSLSGGGFASILADGLKSVETKVSEADAMVRRFALGDDIPVHQVTMALEEARLAVELAMQVRARLLEGYRDLMNMQL